MRCRNTNSVDVYVPRGVSRKDADTPADRPCRVRALGVGPAEPAAATAAAGCGCAGGSSARCGPPGEVGPHAERAPPVRGPRRPAHALCGAAAAAVEERRPPSRRAPAATGARAGEPACAGAAARRCVVRLGLWPLGSEVVGRTGGLRVYRGCPGCRELPGVPRGCRAWSGSPPGVPGVPRRSGSPPGVPGLPQGSRASRLPGVRRGVRRGCRTFSGRPGRPGCRSPAATGAARAAGHPRSRARTWPVSECRAAGSGPRWRSGCRTPGSAGRRRSTVLPQTFTGTCTGTWTVLPDSTPGEPRRRRGARVGVREPPPRRALRRWPPR